MKQFLRVMFILICTHIYSYGDASERNTPEVKGQTSRIRTVKPNDASESQKDLFIENTALLNIITYVDAYCKKNQISPKQYIVTAISLYQGFSYDHDSDYFWKKERPQVQKVGKRYEILVRIDSLTSCAKSFCLLIQSNDKDILTKVRRIDIDTYVKLPEDYLRALANRTGLFDDIVKVYRSLQVRIMETSLSAHFRLREIASIELLYDNYLERRYKKDSFEMKRLKEQKGMLMWCVQDSVGAYVNLMKPYPKEMIVGGSFHIFLDAKTYKVLNWFGYK